MIDRPTIAKIMDATKIEEVVSEFVTLKKRGINYVGLCPFHNDSNPSFSVSPTRGICHCFTCGKGGNAINFLMELEQMTYPDALRWLAKKYKIEIQERELTNEEKQRESERESMFIVNDWAAKYFQDILLHDVDGIAIGMAYFRGRGFRDDIIRNSSWVLRSLSVLLLLRRLRRLVIIRNIWLIRDSASRWIRTKPAISRVRIRFLIVSRAEPSSLGSA